jgi:hypothetical protein
MICRTSSRARTSIQAVVKSTCVCSFRPRRQPAVAVRRRCPAGHRLSRTRAVRSIDRWPYYKGPFNRRNRRSVGAEDLTRRPDRRRDAGRRRRRPPDLTSPDAHAGPQAAERPAPTPVPFRRLPPDRSCADGRTVSRSDAHVAGRRPVMRAEEFAGRGRHGLCGSMQPYERRRPPPPTSSRRWRCPGGQTVGDRARFSPNQECITEPPSPLPATRMMTKRIFRPLRARGTRLTGGLSGAEPDVGRRRSLRGSPFLGGQRRTLDGCLTPTALLWHWSAARAITSTDGHGWILSDHGGGFRVEVTARVFDASSHEICNNTTDDDMHSERMGAH